MTLRIKAKLSFEVRDQWLHLSSGNWVAIGCAVMYYARAAEALSAGIKCQHCILRSKHVHAIRSATLINVVENWIMMEVTYKT